MLASHQKKQVIDVLRRHPTAVLATADAEGQPAAAVVYFAVDDDLAIVFGTHPSRKFNNLKTNPKSALVVTSGLVSVQMHGIAQEHDQPEKAKKIFHEKHQVQATRLPAETVFFILRPEWIRYLDHAEDSPTQFESAL